MLSPGFVPSEPVSGFNPQTVEAEAGFVPLGAQKTTGAIPPLAFNVLEDTWSTAQESKEAQSTATSTRISDKDQV